MTIMLPVNKNGNFWVSGHPFWIEDQDHNLPWILNSPFIGEFGVMIS